MPAARARISRSSPQSLFGVQALGVVHAVELYVRWEDHRGGHHGTGQRSHADFVDTRDVVHAGAPQHPFEVEHAIEARVLFPVPLIAALEQLIDLLHAPARIAAQTVQQLARRRLLPAQIALADLLHGKLVQLDGHLPCLCAILGTHARGPQT